MSHIDLSKVSEQVPIDLCILAIQCTAEAMKTPEGQAAIENGKKEYLLHLALKEKQATSKE